MKSTCKAGMKIVGVCWLAMAGAIWAANTSRADGPSAAVPLSRGFAGAAGPAVAGSSSVPPATRAIGAQPGRIGPQPGVLLLRNGELLEGRILRLGDYYEVLLPHGRMRLRSAEVEAVCRDLEEAYQHKRAALRPDDARGHLLLAWWCINQDLPGHAAAELAEGSRLDPSDPLVELVKRRLDLALDPPVVSAASRAQGPTSDSGPTPEELDRLVRELPSEAVREFRERIQPLLLNSCASGQCHGPQTGGSFRLLRPSFGRVASRRLTQRNLYSVVNHIDPDDPAQSPLLRAACTAHGSPERRSVAPAGSRQYEMLADWVRTLVAPPVEQAASAAGKTAPQQGGAVEPAVFETPVSGGDQSSAPHPAAGEFSTGGMQQSAGGVVPAAFDEQTTPSPVDQPPADRTQGIQYGVRLEAFEPADPFDPEIFNRRYFPQSPDQSPRAGASGDTTPASELSPQVPSSEHATSQPLQFAGGAVGGTPEDASHSASGGMSEPRSSERQHVPKLVPWGTAPPVSPASSAPRSASAAPRAPVRRVWQAGPPERSSPGAVSAGLHGKAAPENLQPPADTAAGASAPDRPALFEREACQSAVPEGPSSGIRPH